MEIWKLGFFVAAFSKESLGSESKLSGLGFRIAQWTFALWTFVELFGGRGKLRFDSKIRRFAGLSLVGVFALAFGVFRNWREFKKNRHSKSLG